MEQSRRVSSREEGGGGGGLKPGGLSQRLKGFTVLMMMMMMRFTARTCYTDQALPLAAAARCAAAYRSGQLIQG
eukprot:1137034-Pelagomonas_calceolata.AAC.6